MISRNIFAASQPQEEEYRPTYVPAPYDAIGECPHPACPWHCNPPNKLSLLNTLLTAHIMNGSSILLYPIALYRARSFASQTRRGGEFPYES